MPIELHSLQLYILPRPLVSLNCRATATYSHLPLHIFASALDALANQVTQHVGRRSMFQPGALIRACVEANAARRTGRPSSQRDSRWLS